MIVAYQSTRAVARKLGIKPSALSRAVWDGRITPPQKGPSGAYLWTDADIQRAARAFGKSYKKPLTGLNSVGVVSLYLRCRPAEIIDLVQAGKVKPKHQSTMPGTVLFDSEEVGIIAGLLGRQNKYEAFRQLPIGKPQGGR